MTQDNKREELSIPEGLVEVVERWKGDLYLDLKEERNPGTDEFARGFNYGLNTARDMIYTRLPQLLAGAPCLIP